MHNKKGAAAIIILLLLIDLALLISILIPVFSGTAEKTRKSIDLRHEQTAKDSALIEIIANKEFTAVYDAQNKKFVSLDDSLQVPAYGESKEHKGKVIYVIARSADEISLLWIEPTRSGIEALVTD